MQLATEKGQLELRWLGHASFLIQGQKVIYIDPYNLSSSTLPKADYVLLTHSHYDHCSVADLEKLVKEGTVIVCTADCQSKITRFQVPISLELVGPHQEVSFAGLKIMTLPAYNKDKHFHPKEEEWVGYAIKFVNENVLVYHAGDTDAISEMQKLTGHGSKVGTFVALLPVGGRFTMTAEEAAEAARLIKPTLAIPMHYGTLAGSGEDANEFVSLCEEYGISAQVLPKQ